MSDATEKKNNKTSIMFQILFKKKYFQYSQLYKQIFAL